MASWQRRARVGIGAAGLAVAAVVYLGLQERPPRQTPPAVDRLDPAAVSETTEGCLQHVRGEDLEFEVCAGHTLYYRDGTTRLFDVAITVHRGEGRTYVITAEEAATERDRAELQLSGDVVLTASDGLRLQTERGSFHREDGVVRAPGLVRFEKGRLTGSGVGMRYDEQRDLLQVDDRSQVRMAGAGGETVTAYSATAATLDRLHDRLTLAGSVSARRDTQVLDADRGEALLTPAHDAITLIELRGGSRVSGGGGSTGTLAARDIDLHYGSSGETLERVALRGAAAVSGVGGDGASGTMAARDIDLQYGAHGEILESVALRGDAAVVIGGAGAGAGRQLAGDVLDLRFASDGTLTSAAGAGGVRLDLPATGATPAGSVRSRTLTARGAPGQGLTDARFETDVEYTERVSTGAPRSARAQVLETTLTDAGIGSARFSVDVVFAADGYHASSDEARYQPDGGRLELRPGAARTRPRLRDARLAIDAQAIDLVLDAETVRARGDVRTAFGGGASDDVRLPGLLQSDVAAQVTADRLDYDGGSGVAQYAGGAVLWQDDTTVRADVIRIDQAGGDLVATGSARSTMPLDGGRIDGRADEIRYDDARRLLVYVAAADSTGGAAAQLVGPAGDLRARHIAVQLRREDGGVERIDAAGDVRVDTDGRVATGAALTYHADDERYEMTGAIDVPVRVRDACADTSGRTLIFFASADRMVVDGHEQVRTRTTSHHVCEGGRRR